MERPLKFFEGAHILASKKNVRQPFGIRKVQVIDIPILVFVY